MIDKNNAYNTIENIPEDQKNFEMMVRNYTNNIINLLTITYLSDEQIEAKTKDYKLVLKNKQKKEQHIIDGVPYGVEPSHLKIINLKKSLQGDDDKSERVIIDNKEVERLVLDKEEIITSKNHKIIHREIIKFETKIRLYLYITSDDLGHLKNIFQFIDAVKFIFYQLCINNKIFYKKGFRPMYLPQISIIIKNHNISLFNNSVYINKINFNKNIINFEIKSHSNVNNHEFYFEPNIEQSNFGAEDYDYCEFKRLNNSFNDIKNELTKMLFHNINKISNTNDYSISMYPDKLINEGNGPILNSLFIGEDFICKNKELDSELQLPIFKRKNLIISYKDDMKELVFKILQIMQDEAYKIRYQRILDIKKNSDEKDFAFIDNTKFISIEETNYLLKPSYKIIKDREKDFADKLINLISIFNSSIKDSIKKQEYKSYIKEVIGENPENKELKYRIKLDDKKSPYSTSRSYEDILNEFPNEIIADIILTPEAKTTPDIRDLQIRIIKDDRFNDKSFGNSFYYLLSFENTSNNLFEVAFNRSLKLDTNLILNIIKYYLLTDKSERFNKKNLFYRLKQLKSKCSLIISKKITYESIFEKWKVLRKLKKLKNEAKSDDDSENIEIINYFIKCFKS